MNCHGQMDQTMMSSTTMASTMMACHRAGHMDHSTSQHCEGMLEQASAGNHSPGQSGSDHTSGSRLTSIDEPSKCPMNCCLQMGGNHGATITINYGDSQQSIVERIIPSISIVFTTSGFSSHTDRGPPLG
ncbi:MAG TPA: hypothetical protein VKZ53_08680 [Candidatus Angelobacter sp.]|nr:hypothetical protein [Candidatus Angelobacter sp.]